ncbi:MAG: hypothetical protein M3Z66_21030 [Chloroflexota bacterium]|nr:hypothetical protein [Chloroflexota bacterium]
MAITQGVVGVYNCYNTCSQQYSACTNTAWGCHDGYCNNNNYLCAWPYFNECSKQNCPKQPDVVWGGGCCYQIVFTNPCNSYGAGCAIVDCSPDLRRAVAVTRNNGSVRLRPLFDAAATYEGQCE